MKNLFSYGLVRYRRDLSYLIQLSSRDTPIPAVLFLLLALSGHWSSTLSDLLRKSRCPEEVQLADFLWNTFVSVCSDCQISDKDLLYLEGRFKSEGYKFLTVTIVDLDKALLRGIRDGEFHCPNSFKQRCGTKLPNIFFEYFSEVFDKDGRLLETASPISVSMLRQLCGLCYKVNLPSDKEQERDVIERFISNEEELPSALDKRSKFIHRMAHHAKCVFDDYKRFNLRFKHGPGVTADTEFMRKWDQPLPGFDANFQFADASFFNENDLEDRSYRLPVLDHTTLFQGGRAKVLLVPKDSRGPRLISAEPCSLQYLQQGIKGYIVDKLQSHPLTSGSVNFTWQSVNQSIAQSGSVDQSWSTLDLKDASDRISMDLVEGVFEGVPDLLADLCYTRSVSTQLPDGSVVHLTKFAPMGSALCFPILATCVYLASLTACELVGVPPMYAKNFIRVYGDDIAVKRGYEFVVIAALEHIGLKLNRDKCFINSRFLESCGMDAFDGNDVTPVRIRQWISPTGDTMKVGLYPTSIVKSIVSINETANLLHSKGYRIASEYLHSLVERYCGPLPHGLPQSPYLCRWTSSTDVWGSTLMRRDLKRKLTGSNTLKVRAVFVGDEPPLNSKVHGWGHMLRTWKMLHKGRELPLQGEFKRRHGILLDVRYIDENDTSEYPPNEWLPLVADKPKDRKLTDRELARRKLAEINGLL